MFNPLEVIPEYTADFATKKGEKIDYTIMVDEKPAILIECKHCSEDLPKHSGQLFRYFSTLPGKKLAILTNGIRYMLFSDIEEANKLDEKPFFDFDITDIKDSDIDEIKKLHKNILDMDHVLDSANELKYTKELKRLILYELTEPSEEFVIFVTRLVYTGILTANRKAFFEPLVKRSLKQVIDEIFRDRLDRALSINQKMEENSLTSDETNTENEKESSRIITTDEELESFNIIRAILCRDISIQRIQYRDYQSFFSLNLDNKVSAKMFCKLILTSKKKTLILLKQDRTETAYEISSITDLYNYSNEIIEAAKSFDA